MHRAPHTRGKTFTAPLAFQTLGRIPMRMKISVTAAGFAALLAGAVPGPAAAQTRTTLDIYVVDVEGGNATLFIPPSGESVLIDTGNVPPAAARDADRIMAAVKDAGL